VLAAAPIAFPALVPEVILATGGCVVLILGQAAAASVRRSVQWLSLLTIVLAIFALRSSAGWGGADAVGGSGLEIDRLANFVRIGTLIVGVLIVLVSWMQSNEGERGEFFAMLLLSLTGLMLVGSATNLVVLFLALELVSIPTYIMVVLSRPGPRALEGATKYFYLGAMSAAIMAFGFSYLYGVIGSATLDQAAIGRLSAALADPGAPEHAYATIGLLVSLVGLLFKIAAVPLHFYIADVYEGAASPVAGLLGFVPKLAGLVAIFRVITLTGWATTEGALFWFLWVVAVLSMTVGNVLALRQRNIKRMLAYSGIAHSGYMLVGVLAGPLTGGRADSIMGDGTGAVLYYVMIYGIANLGAFALLGLLRMRGRACETLRDVAGLLRYYPTVALLMSLAMFTLMGLPPTPGFWGKLSMFGSALAAAEGAARGGWIIALVIIAVLNSALAAAYYLRVIAAVLLYETDEPAEASPREAPLMGAMLCGFMLIAFAFYPNSLLRMGRDATGELRSEPAITRTMTPAAGEGEAPAEPRAISHRP